MKVRKSTANRNADERIEKVSNKYASNAFMFLAYYLFVSILIKSFILDVNIFIYWDNAIAMIFGILYIIYRSADKGVPFDPVSVKVFDPDNIKVFGVVSLLFGLFVTFFISGMDDRLAALMPGIVEKLVGAFAIGIAFLGLIFAAIWLIDVLPTKLAFRKAAKMVGDSEEILPSKEEIIKHSHTKDERIDTTIEKYTAHAFLFLCGYVCLGSLIKIFALDVAMINYYDAFIAAMVACGYFSFKILRAGVYDDYKLSKKEKLSGWMTSIASFLAFGMFMSFIVFPMDEKLAARFEGFGEKFLFGIFMALLFGLGMVLIGKAMDWYVRKRAEKLIDE